MKWPFSKRQSEPTEPNLDDLMRDLNRSDDPALHDVKRAIEQVQHAPAPRARITPAPNPSVRCFDRDEVNPEPLKLRPGKRPRENTTGKLV